MSVRNSNLGTLLNAQPSAQPRLSRISAASPAPRFQFKVEVPNDCNASVVFRRVSKGGGSQGGDVYAFWFLVGRAGSNSTATLCECVDGDIRCDLPIGAEPMSSASLEPYLEAFLRAVGAEGLPPTLVP